VDSDDDNGGHTIVDISTEPPLTPKMPTAPIFQRQKSSPRSQLRREIFEVKRSITRIEHEMDNFEAKIATLETREGDFMARAGKEPSFWQRVDDTTRSIQTLSEQNLERSKQLTRDKDRLVWLERKLARAEDAAVERAEGMLAYQLPAFCK
jgi:septal ring factor EnvC (AmiA/AmiB activator)